MKTIYYYHLRSGGGGHFRAQDDKEARERARKINNVCYLYTEQAEEFKEVWTDYWEEAL